MPAAWAMRRESCSTVDSRQPTSSAATTSRPPPIPCTAALARPSRTRLMPACFTMTAERYPAAATPSAISTETFSLMLQLIRGGEPPRPRPISVAG